MILRRISEALRNQDWFTVVVELLVVVIGIFLGLQVDDWNEARKESVQEVVYLQRLLADTEEMIAQHAAYAKRAQSKIEDLHIIWRHVSFAVNPDAINDMNILLSWQSENYTQSVSYDIDELCKTATFNNGIVEVFDSAKDRLGVGGAFVEQLRVLRTLLVQRLHGGAETQRG